MQNLINKLQLEKADYKKVKEGFSEFMYEAMSSIEKAMIKQIPEFAKLNQSRSLAINNIELAMESVHFDMLQQYEQIMGAMRKMEIEVYFCLGMKFAKEL